jgi:hypothetical protein
MGCIAIMSQAQTQICRSCGMMRAIQAKELIHRPSSICNARRAATSSDRNSRLTLVYRQARAELEPEVDRARA